MAVITPSESDESASGSGPPPLKHACRKCGRAIDPHDPFCRFCGARQVVSDPFYYHPVWILVLAFLVLGPFALGLVWRAQTMGRTTKLVLAAVITIYSAVTIYAAYVIVAAVYRELMLLNQVL